MESNNSRSEATDGSMSDREATQEASLDGSSMRYRSGNPSEWESWYIEYMKESTRRLSQKSKVIHAVQTDNLDSRLVERRIRDMMTQIPITNGFCAKCQDLFDDWPKLFVTPDSRNAGNDSSDGFELASTSGRGSEHRATRPFQTAELEASKRNGCKFCDYMLQALNDSELLDTFRKIEARMAQIGKKAWCCLSIGNMNQHTGRQVLWLNYPSSQWTHHTDAGAVELCLTDLFPSLPLSDYDPRDVLSLVELWLRNCMRDHEVCKAAPMEYLPTRLISVAHDSVRLVNTSELTGKPQYSTLSHAWGSKPFLQLTSETYHSFLKEVPFSELTKTFREAIEISRRLGMEFIWIDSLCIVQGDAKDWERESSLMSSVYGGSAINIAAASAVDGTQGFPLERPFFGGGFVSRVVINGNAATRTFHKGSEDPTTSSYLATRAWTLQERLLAPRTIHLGDKGAFWECRHTIASEMQPGRYHHSSRESLVNRNGQTLKRRWPDIVNQYSKANLSFGTDKLPALSGIAREVYNESADEYLAGIWRADIERQLCWKRTATATKRPQFRAPTWSWASIDGPVALNLTGWGIFGDEYAHVADADIKLSGQGPFGQVQSGVISISCSLLMPGRLLGPGTSSDLFSGRDNLEIFNFTPTDHTEVFEVQIDCLDEVPDKDETVYMLPFYGGATGGGGESRSPNYSDVSKRVEIYGILLYPSSKRVGEYQRLGSFKVTGYRGVRTTFNSQDGNSSEVSRYETGKYFPFLRILAQIGERTAEGACARTIEHPRYSGELYLIHVL